jgi:hypothetical protein
MKKLSVYTIIVTVLLLVGAGIWQGCKPKEEPGPTIPTTENISGVTYYHFAHACEEKTTNTGGVLLSELMIIALKDKTFKAELNGEYLSYNQVDFGVIKAEIQQISDALKKGNEGFDKDASLNKNMADRLKKLPNFKGQYTVDGVSVQKILKKEEVKLASLFPQDDNDGNRMASIAIELITSILATPAYAQQTVVSPTYSSRAGTFRIGKAYYNSYGSVVPKPGISITTLPLSEVFSPREIAIIQASWSSDLPSGDQPPQEETRESAANLNLPSPSDQQVKDLEGGYDRMREEAERYANGDEDAANEVKKFSGGSWGDPHLITLDKLKYDFQAMGEFAAIKSTTDKFEVQTRFGASGQSAVTFNQALAVNTGSDIISYELRKDYLYVNKQQVKLSQIENPYTLPGGGSISKTNNRSGLLIKTPNNDQILINNGFYFQPAENRKGKLVGLLGNFDGELSNDGKTRDNKTINLQRPEELYPAYANSWRISQSESLFFYENGTSTQTYTDLSKPNSRNPLEGISLATLAGAEATCRQAGVNREPELRNCIMDVALTGDLSYARQAAILSQAIPTDNNFLSLAPYSGKSSQGAVAVTVGDKIYAGLGTNQLDWAMYDPATDRWTMKTPFSAGKTSFVRMGTFVIGKKVYCVGGWIDQTATNALWEYDTDTDKWTKRKDLPGAARYNIAAFAAGGKGYALFGTIGWGGQADYPTKSAMYEYDPTTDNWTTKADFPANPRGNNINNTEFNGMVMLINGRPFVGNGSGGTIFSDWYEYIPTRDAWEKRANSFGGTYYFSVGNIGYVLNHSGRSYAMTYDATTDTWSKYPGKEIYVPLQTNVARGVYQVPTLNGKSYLGLGNGIKDWWSFTP